MPPGEACFGGLAACTLPTWTGPEALCLAVAGLLHGGKHKASEIFSSYGVSSLVLQMYQFEPIWGDPEKSQKQVLARFMSRHGAGSLPQLQSSCPKPARLPCLGVSAPEGLLRLQHGTVERPATSQPAPQRLRHHLCRVFSGRTLHKLSVSQTFAHCIGPTALKCWR